MNIKSISYFTDHNLLRRMPQNLLHRLLLPYGSFFRQHGVSLPPTWGETSELPLDAICMALMDVHTDEKSSELIEELIMLQTLINNKELIEPRLDRLVSKDYAGRPELQRVKGETETDFILKLWLEASIRPELESLVPWLQAKTAKVYAEFTLRETYCPTALMEGDLEKGKSDQDLNALMKLGLNGITQRAQEGERTASERISAHFRSKGYTDFCEIKAYPCEENCEIVFIVDHGGKQQRVNTLTQEKKKDVTAFTPLLNDVVIVMPDRALMRISTRMSWCETLYREVFGIMLLNDQYAFEMRELYHFEPMFDKPPVQALALAGYHNVIKSVELKSITYFQPDENIGIYTRVDSEKKLMYAKHLQQGIPTSAQKVVLALYMRKRHASRPITVTIQKGKGKGIGCSVDSYYPIITKWLTSLGFRQGISGTKTCCLLNEAAKSSDTVLEWKRVTKALKKEHVSLNYLEKACGPRTRLFLEKYLRELPDEPKAQVWYESETEFYRIIEHNDAYLIADPKNTCNTFGEVDDIDEIVLYTIDKNSLYTDIYKIICDKLRKPAEPLSDRIYGGSILASRGLNVWLFFPSSPEDISYLEIMRKNNRSYRECCLILPRCGWDKQDDWFQKVYLDSLLEINGSGQLAVTDELADHVEDRSKCGQEGPPYRKWHLTFPQNRDWGHIEMKFGFEPEKQQTMIHITYGAGLRAPQAFLKHSDIIAFTKQSAVYGWKKEFLLLLQLAGRMHTKGYFERTSIGSELNRLANSLAEYFCIDGLFYEEVPNNDASRKRYRLKFKTSLDRNLTEIPLVKDEEDL